MEPTDLRCSVVTCFLFTQMRGLKDRDKSLDLCVWACSPFLIALGIYSIEEFFLTLICLDGNVHRDFLLVSVIEFIFLVVFLVRQYLSTSWTFFFFNKENSWIWRVLYPLILQVLITSPNLVLI